MSYLELKIVAWALPSASKSSNANFSSLEFPKHFPSAAFVFPELFMRIQPSSQIRPQAAEPSRVLLMARDAYGFTTRINDFKRGGADPSQTKFFIGGNDVTQSSRVTNVGNGSVEVSFKLKEPLKAQASLEVRLETNKRGGGTVESKVVADVVAKVNINSLLINFVAEDINTQFPDLDFPIFIDSAGVTVAYLKPDVTTSRVIEDILVSIYFTDETGNVINLSSNEVFRFEDSLFPSGIKSKSGKIVNSVLKIPISIDLDKNSGFNNFSINKLYRSASTESSTSITRSSTSSVCMISAPIDPIIAQLPDEPCGTPKNCGPSAGRFQGWIFVPTVHKFIITVFPLTSGTMVTYIRDFFEKRPLAAVSTILNSNQINALAQNLQVAILRTFEACIKDTKFCSSVVDQMKLARWRFINQLPPVAKDALVAAINTIPEPQRTEVWNSLIRNLSQYGVSFPRR
jgi:hypothetical protein